MARCWLETASGGQSLWYPADLSHRKKGILTQEHRQVGVAVGASMLIPALRNVERCVENGQIPPEVAAKELVLPAKSQSSVKAGRWWGYSGKRSWVCGS